MGAALGKGPVENDLPVPYDLETPIAIGAADLPAKFDGLCTAGLPTGENARRVPYLPTEPSFECAAELPAELNMGSIAELSAESEVKYIAELPTEFNVEYLHRKPAVLTQIPKFESSLFRDRPLNTIKHDTPTSDKTARQISEKFVPLSTEGRYVEAFPDTGSELNIISKDLCHKFGLILDKSQAQPVRKPTGRKIMTLGTVDLDFSFLMESSNYKRKFHVLERTVHDIILGKSFLETTQTLTTFAHRIKSRLVDINSRMGRLLLLGSGAERVVGSINGIPATAMDDTGSDVMVISWKEAERLRLHISTDVSHRKTLEFIDGEEIFTDGAVLGADWRFGSNPHAEAIRVDLQVVRGLECSLILSNEVLFENNAYSNSEYFLDKEKGQYAKSQGASLCVIMDRTGQKPIIDSVANYFRSKSSRARMEDQGLVRKAERTFDGEVARQLAEEERINALPAQLRRDAWERENETRRRWNQTFIPQLSGQFSSSTPNTSASGTGGRPLDPGTATKWTSWKRRLRVISKKTGTDSVP